MTRSRRPKPKPLTKPQRALLGWVTDQMADPVAAAQAYQVISKHAGLIHWMVDAEISQVMPAPQRRHLGDPRDANRLTGFLAARGPDDAMIDLIDARIDGHGLDPEHLDPVRQYLAHRLGELASWYLDHTGTILPDRWEPLAVRLGDLVGDQTAANALATCVLGHHHLAITALIPSRGVCQAGRERWRRLAERYVRTLDEQPGKGRLTLGGRVAVESVGLDDVRRFG